MPRDIRKNMQAVRSSGSAIENRLGKALWAAGFRYRRNNRKRFGKPDFTLRRARIAIFADSEFWHGKDWERRKLDHKSNIDFWNKKIESNRLRDAQVNQKLENDGWLVIRFWGNQITKNLDECLEKVRNAVAARHQ